MSGNTILKRLLDAGVQFTEMSQSSAEKIVNEFVNGGQMRRKDAEKAVRQLVERGRSSTEQLLSTIQSEVAKQLGRFADRLDGIEVRVEDLAATLGMKQKAAAPKAAAPAAPAAAKQPAAKKAPAKKAAAKKAPAGTSGVAKVVTKKAAKR